MNEYYPLYQQISLIYYHEHKYAASVHFFLFCVQIQPENSNAWYGLGDAICALAKEQQDEEIYDLGISFIKKSLSIDATNQYSGPMLARMTQAPHIGQLRIQNIPTFDIENIEKVKEQFMLHPEELASYFKLCNDDNRIRLAMLLCDMSDYFSFNLLNDLVITDKNKHVRLAIMKRLVVYCSQPQLKETFEYLFEKNLWSSYEPYFSHTLRQISAVLPKMKMTDWATKILETINGSNGSERTEQFNLSDKDEIPKQRRSADTNEKKELEIEDVGLGDSIKPWWKFW